MCGSLASVWRINGSLEAAGRDQQAMESALISHQHSANCNMQWDSNAIDADGSPYLEIELLINQIHFLGSLINISGNLVILR